MNPVFIRLARLAAVALFAGCAGGKAVSAEDATAPSRSPSDGGPLPPDAAPGFDRYNPAPTDDPNGEQSDIFATDLAFWWEELGEPLAE